ncbi:MAG: hypothetical protein ACK52I_00495 [Pseudomonadota bacterium]|jgi:hypothetical protein
MKTLNELRDFCEGYHRAMLNTGGDKLVTALDYVVWGGYDIHFFGVEYSEHAKTDYDLHVEAYGFDMIDGNEEPLHSFTLTTEGESK